MPLDTILASTISGNTLAVTANNGSSIAASNVNFNNTSSISVSVTQGPTGTANVSLSAPSVRSIAVTIALGG